MEVINYALVRYCPNIDKGEFLVVGYMGQYDKGRDAYLCVHRRFSENPGLRYMFGEEHRKTYEDLMRGFVNEWLRYTNVWWKDTENKVEGPLVKYAVPTNDPISLSNIRTICGYDVDGIIESLREKYAL